jgi:hypothetical protein
MSLVGLKGMPDETATKEMAEEEKPAEENNTENNEK